MLGTGVITDVVANTAAGHTRTSSGETAAGYKPTLLTSGGTGATTARKAASHHRVRHRSAESLQASSAPSTAASSSSGSSGASSSSSGSASASASTASSAPAVVAVSGGS